MQKLNSKYLIKCGSVPKRGCLQKSIYQTDVRKYSRFIYRIFDLVFNSNFYYLILIDFCLISIGFMFSLYNILRIVFPSSQWALSDYTLDFTKDFNIVTHKKIILFTEVKKVFMIKKKFYFIYTEIFKASC